MSTQEPPAVEEYPTVISKFASGAFLRSFLNPKFLNSWTCLILVLLYIIITEDIMTWAGAIISQTFFIPKPKFTEKELPDQTGKVHIVTGGYAGVGEQLVKILYSKNATVYVAGRSQSKAEASIKRLRDAHPGSNGKVEFLSLDLADLSTVKAAAESFMEKESRLDTLTNNAGVMNTSPKMTTKQGHELQLGTNCLGPWLFSQHLLPILRKTAATAPKDSVRVTWASSIMTWISPRNGITFDPTTKSPKLGSMKEINYGASKTGNMFLASEFAKRYSADGIVSVSWNPGNLKSELQRHTAAPYRMAMKYLLYPAKFGAYTELYAGFSPEVTMRDAGSFYGPWGRKFEPRTDIAKGLKAKSVEGTGTGTAEMFWEWCERETKA